ncbi:MAG TPA: hypothetical protein VFH99_03445 [Candidatus Saccharimonadales bacterium]|nr:hypothetical protein [Candidatus Saccharimonadales bacterium]
MRQLQTNILRVLRSPRFYKAVLALFVLESAWIAVSAAYPMVFDENTQFGVIQLYSHRWNPVFFSQPPHAAWAGPLAREPSYLYQYLMSFPYRLITLFTGNLMIQVIFLRFINIALFGTGLVLFHRLLRRTKVSAAMSNGILLFFVLIPVVPLLAGQINYDNLVMPLAALALLLTLSVSDYLGRRGRLPAGRSLQLLTLCMFGSLVQFEFLPIFAGIVLWLGWQIWRQTRQKSLELAGTIRDGWHSGSWQRKLAVGLPLAIAAMLFVEMYGVNLVVYHNPTPACDQVLSAQECAGYGAWQRDQIALAHKSPVNANPLLYGASWTYRMFVASFYTSSGGASPQAYYLSVNPLPVIFVAALAVFLVGIALFVIYHRTIFRRYRYIGFLLFICIFYGVLLWLRNYADFVHVGQKIAINGRYLFPIALPAMLLVALAYRQAFAQKHHLKLGLIIVLFLLFLQGGGALTYIAVSNQHWYWQNRTVIGMNHSAQRIVRPFIVVRKPLKSFG